MAGALEINEKKLLPIKEASSLVSYSRDYITALARDKKISGAFIGRQWYVDPESLKNYEEMSTLEASLRKQRLSDERKREQLIRSKVKAREALRKKGEEVFRLKVTAVASLVLALGLVSGMFMYDWAETTNPNRTVLVASTANVKTFINNRGETVVTDLQVNGSQGEDVGQSASQDIRPIGDDIENGVLLLPDSPVNASAIQMFSDDVVVMTAVDGTQVVVKVDKSGKPTGEVVPFVVVPVGNRSNI